MTRRDDGHFVFLIFFPASEYKKQICSHCYSFIYGLHGKPGQLGINSVWSDINTRLQGGMA